MSNSDAPTAGHQVEPDPFQVEGLTVKEAAEHLGVSEKTVRHRIKLGQVVARKLETPQGYQWRVYLDRLPPGVQVVPDPLPIAFQVEHDTVPDQARRVLEFESSIPESNRELEPDPLPDPFQVEGPIVLEVLRMLDERQARIDQLQAELLEASTAAAHWQARAITAEQTVQQLLPAPKDEAQDAGDVEAQAQEAATRAALAEAERDRLQTELQQAKRPWWKRLLG